MRNFCFVTSFLANIVFLSYFFYQYNFSQKTDLSVNALQQRVEAKHAVPEKQHRIAILTPASHPALEQVQKGFQDTLLNKYKVHANFAVYNANGNRTLMRSQIEEIIQKQYDLVFTIGAHATQMAKEITTKKQSFVPIVFGAVADPVRLKIVDNEQASGTHVTGAATGSNYRDQITLLLKLKPQIKKVLIVYDPTQSSGLEKDKFEVEKIWAERGVRVQAVEVYKTSEVVQKVTSLLRDVDLLMVFKDNTVVAGIDGVIKLCARYGVTCLTSDLDSVDKGAVLGFGVHEYDFGVASAEQTYKILKEEQKPANMPILFTRTYKLKLNTQAMQEQGLSIDQEQLLLMKSIEVI